MLDELMQTKNQLAISRKKLGEAFHRLNKRIDLLCNSNKEFSSNQLKVSSVIEELDNSISAIESIINKNGTSNIQGT
jgi:phage-related minor tail protein